MKLVVKGMLPGGNLQLGRPHKHVSARPGYALSGDPPRWRRDPAYWQRVAEMQQEGIETGEESRGQRQQVASGSVAMPPQAVGQSGVSLPNAQPTAQLPPASQPPEPKKKSRSYEDVSPKDQRIADALHVFDGDPRTSLARIQIAMLMRKLAPRPPKGQPDWGDLTPDEAGRVLGLVVDFFRHGLRWAARKKTRADVFDAAKMTLLNGPWQMAAQEDGEDGRFYRFLTLDDAGEGMGFLIHSDGKHLLGPEYMDIAGAQALYGQEGSGRMTKPTGAVERGGSTKVKKALVLGYTPSGKPVPDDSHLVPTDFDDVDHAAAHHAHRREAREHATRADELARLLTSDSGVDPQSRMGQLLSQLAGHAGAVVRHQHGADEHDRRFRQEQRAQAQREALKQLKQARDPEGSEQRYEHQTRERSEGQSRDAAAPEQVVLAGGPDNRAAVVRSAAELTKHDRERLAKSYLHRLRCQLEREG